MPELCDTRLTAADESANVTVASGEPASDSPEVSYRRIAWERVGALGRFFAVGALAGVIIAICIPSRYTSTVRLMPPDLQSMSSAAMVAALTGGAPSASAAGLASSLLGTRSTGATFLGILESRTVQDDLINKFDLRRVYRTKRYMDARQELGQRTYAREDKQSGIITISVEDTEPSRARDLAAAYIADLDRLVVTMNTSAAHRERVFLEERLRTVKEDVDASAEALSKFSSKNATLDMQTQGKAMLDATGRLQAELIAGESELRGLKQLYADDNVRVRSAEARISELQEQLRKLEGTANETGGDLAPGAAYPSLRKLPLLAVTYGDLLRRMKIQEAVFEILTKQYELAKIQEAKEIPTVKVLDAPDLPEKKSFPPRLLIVLAGAISALAAGFGWIWLQEFWTRMDDMDTRKIAVHHMTRSINRIFAVRICRQF